MEATLVETILFIAFGVMAVAGALSVILARDAVYSALGLLANFTALGALYIMLNAEFLGIVQWIVYSGAIVVLFLFALMLIGGRKMIDQASFRPFISWIAVALGILLLGELGYLALSAGLLAPVAPAAAAEAGNVEQLGMALFTDYLLPFELASVLLLVGIVGAVAIGKSRRPA